MKPIYLILIGLIAGHVCFAQFESYATLADRAQDKLYNSFRSSGGTYYIENNGSSNTYFHYWWNAHALDVLVDAYERTNDSKYATRINSLVNNWSANNGGTIYKDYYDDMEWFTLALFRAWKATGNSTFLTMSTNLWDDIKTGENANQGGGIAWRKTQLNYKNTPANGPAIIYACRRYQEWGHSWELDLATDLYGWLKSTLRESSGRINDGINRLGDGQIDYWQLTYNYGTFIGAALEMYQSTGNSVYLNDAIATADFAINSGEISTNGIFNDEGTGDAGLFKGILARYLALLAQEPAVPSAKKSSYLNALEDQALSIHQIAYNRTYDIVGHDWAQGSGSTAYTSSQLSGIMMLEVATDLGFSAPSPPVVVYEDCNYGGWAVPLGEGNYTMSQLQALGVPNDKVSSIQVQNGYTVTLYEHYDFTGNTIVRTDDDSCLDNEGFNDEVSSLIIAQNNSRVTNQHNLRTTGEEENKIKAETRVFPNPISRGKYLKIQLGDQYKDNLEIHLLDIMGRKLLSFQPDKDDQISISTGDLKPGAYFMQLMQDGKVSSQKVIVK